MNYKPFIIFISTILLLFTCSGTALAAGNHFVTNQKIELTTNKSISTLNSPTKDSLKMASVNPALLNSNNNSSLVPLPFKFTASSTGNIVTISKNSVTNTGVNLPAGYDLRTVGKVPSVKDQGPLGTCWAFATYGSLESCLLPSGNYDFSENNMKNLLSSAYPDGFDRNYGDGGNFLMSTAYLARWSGPVNETDDPYNVNNGNSPTGLSSQVHVQDVFFIPARSGSLDNDNLKQALMTYGAIYTNIYMDLNYFNATTNSYYYKLNDAVSNHAVCIVGWNDNYSRYNFKTTAPGNGAFIVKNSWGTDWGEKGYFYVSYYDANIGLDNALFIKAEPTTNYNKIYQYDPLGWDSSAGYGTKTAWGSNVFKSTGYDKLSAISTYFYSSLSTYKIYIYLNPNPDDPSSGKLATYQTGTITTPGYETIKLKNPVYLSKGQLFSVVVKFTDPEYVFPLPMETPIDFYSSKAIASAGQSYIGLDGVSWSDLNEIFPNTNLCLKAFTEALTADVGINLSLIDPQKTFTLNDSVGFITTLSNTGPDIATGVQVYENIPSSLKCPKYWVSWDNGTTWIQNDPSYNLKTGIWTVPNLTVNPSQKAMLKIYCTVNQTGTVSVKAIKTFQNEYDPTEPDYGIIKFTVRTPTSHHSHHHSVGPAKKYRIKCLDNHSNLKHQFKYLNNHSNQKHQF